MFERFTERARLVLGLAQDEARALNHNYIGTEHLLLGLLGDEEGFATRVLEPFGITVEIAREQVARIVGRGDEATTGQIPFTPRAKEMLELAQRESLALRHNHLGTEHLLLGLLRLDDSVGVRVLHDLGADTEILRDEVIRFLPAPRRLGEPPDRMSKSPAARRRGSALAAVFVLGVLVGRASRGH